MALFGSSNWLVIIIIGFVVGLLARFLTDDDGDAFSAGDDLA